jgi:MSHA biogenesis protein MshO
VQVRGELISKGRLALERLARELRQAAPNTVRLVGGGTGVEFLTTRFGGRMITLDDLFAGGDFSDSSRRFSSGTSLSELYTAEAGYSFSAGDMLLIGNTSPSDIDAGTTIVPLTATAATTVVNDATTDGQILTFAAHSFPFDSPGKHYFIVDHHQEVGLAAGALRLFRTSGTASYDNAASYGGSDPVLVDGVTSVTFSYNPGTTQSNGVLSVDLELTDPNSPDETIRLYHEIHVRNTP